MSDKASNTESMLNNLPDQPGVYLMKDEQGEIIYVGKAQSLRDRVRSYFRGSSPHPRRQKLRESIADFDTIPVETEQQALEVEYDLIKSHRPRFNISYRDNKRYPYIKITMDEPYPRVLTSRKKIPGDDARYFGPYTNVGSMRKTLSTIRDIFPFRSCNDDLPPGGDEERFSVCLDYHIKQCEAPCVGKQSVDSYREMIEDLCEFLRGNYGPIRERLEETMDKHAEEHRYEAASIYRDRLEALEETVDHQPFIEATEHADVLGLGHAESVTAVVMLVIRDHRMVHRREFTLRSEAPDPGEALEEFVLTFYERQNDLPRRLLVAEELPDEEWVGDRLAEWAGRSVEIRVPRQGEKRRLIRSAERSAELEAREQSISLRKREGDVLSVSQHLLDLDRLPQVIEGFDISHTQGNETVAGMVRFVNGEPEKQDYRRFKIREVDDGDDYGAMREVLRRRVHRLREEDRTMPDLFFVDGGRGQLSAAREVLDETRVDCPVTSLAKERELLFVDGREAPYDLPEESPVLQLFQRIRDEAHRFAVDYHRTRRQGMLNSRLSEVKGIGEQRLKKLVETFGSPARAREAEIDELTDIAGITDDIARAIKQES